MRGTVVGIDRSLPMLRAATGSSAAQALACADARLLPLRDRSADVVLMLWLLHHLADKTVAVSEAQRILRSGGQLIAATSEASETGPHADLIREAFTRVLGRDCDRWLEPLDFHVDNGRHVLRQHFEAITVHHSSINFELDDPEPLVNYLDSGRAPIEAELGSDLPWLDILTTTRTLVSAHIRSHGSLGFSRRSATFVAR